MSKYKAGDKVVVKIGEEIELFGRKGCDLTSIEPLTNYTEPLQNKVADQRKEINHLLRKIKEKEAAIERLEDELRSRAQKLTWQKGVEAGQKEAWELARKIASTAGGLSSSELVEIFNAFLPRDILSENTYLEAAAKVEAWEKAKPLRTIFDDFLEKYPNALVNDEGVPYTCPYTLGYGEKIKDCTKKMNCFDCWNRTLEQIGEE